MVGTWQASPAVPTAANVPPCHHHWAERVQPCYLLGQVRTIRGTSPTGRAIHHGAHQP